MSDLLYESDWPVVAHFVKHGPAPVIGTFEPIKGDMGRDGDWPLAQIRMFDDKSGWLPSFDLVPRQTHPHDK